MTTAPIAASPIQPIGQGSYPGWSLVTRSPWITVTPDSASVLAKNTTATDLLRRNAAFPPRLKWGSAPGGQPSLRLDLLAGDEDPVDFIPAATAALTGPAVAPVGSGPASRGASSLDPDVLMALVSESGWEARRSSQDDATILVGLGLAGTPPVLINAGAPHGGLELSFRFPNPHPVENQADEAPVVSWARARLLLCLGEEIRLVVPALEADVSFMLRVSLPGIADPDRIHHALSALWLAASLSQREFDALADEALAQTYLDTFVSIRGRTTKPQT